MFNTREEAEAWAKKYLDMEVNKGQTITKEGNGYVIYALLEMSPQSTKLIKYSDHANGTNVWSNSHKKVTQPTYNGVFTCPNCGPLFLKDVRYHRSVMVVHEYDLDNVSVSLSGSARIKVTEDGAPSEDEMRAYFECKKCDSVNLTCVAPVDEVEYETSY